LSPFHWIRQNLDKIVEKRILNKVKRKDYVQILLETQSENVDKEKDLQHYDSSSVNVDKKMTLKVKLKRFISIKSTFFIYFLTHQRKLLINWECFCLLEWKP
jgi:hypothetical protein